MPSTIIRPFSRNNKIRNLIFSSLEQCLNDCSYCVDCKHFTHCLRIHVLLFSSGDLELRMIPLILYWFYGVSAWNILEKINYIIEIFDCMLSTRKLASLPKLAIEYSLVSMLHMMIASSISSTRVWPWFESLLELTAHKETLYMMIHIN